MWKIFKYKFLRDWRGTFVWIYTFLIFSLTSGIGFFTSDPAKTVSSILSFLVLLIPLILLLFTVIDYYNDKDFISLILSYPIGREDVFLGKTISRILSLSLAWTSGYLLPMILKGWFSDAVFWLYLAGLILTFSIVPIGLLFGILCDEKITGISLAVIFWFSVTILYDTVILLISLNFSEYPVEKVVIPLIFLNPVDLARILVVRSLDIAALMGYTGALFDEIFKGILGLFLILLSLSIWTILPTYLAYNIFKKKDF